MKRIYSVFLVLCLLSVLFTVYNLRDWVQRVDSGTDLPAISSFRDMEYVRPDMDAHDRVLAQSCLTARESEDLDEVLAAIDEYYIAYDRIAASYSLADIYSCADATDSYWQEEAAFCATAIVEADTGLEEFYCALALSPIVEDLETLFGQGFFDPYLEMGSPDETLQAYMEQEATLAEEFATLYTQLSYDTFYTSDTAALPLAELLTELIALRQEMAAYLGYDSYPEMAYDFYHYRDYTPHQATDYLSQIAPNMAQMYRDTFYSPLWDAGYVPATEAAVLTYLDSTTTAMGGNIREAFEHMHQMQLYDIAISPNKLEIAFETYIYYYNQPYIFTCPYGMRSDCLDFAHEFGHFTNDYLCDPSYVGTDVAEIHSQAMEYLSLCYAEGGQQLREYKLLDCLGVYVEQAAYGLFEHQMYDLTGDQLTPENLQALFLQIGEAFGFDAWEVFNGWEFVTISHLYENPMYVISYVVSNDLAFQIYQKELQQPGAGLELYRETLESEESYLLTFAQTYALESPFADGRLRSVAQTLKNELGI